MYTEKDMLVRAKDKDTGEWIYGYYYHYEDAVFCFEEDYAKLSATGEDPRHDAILFDRAGDWGLPNRHMKAEPLIMETLSRRSPFYIKKDKFRSFLYEGDIVSFIVLSKTYTGILRYGEYASAAESEPYHFGWYVEWLDKVSLRPEAGYWMKQDSLRLEGNIWDNPEWLKSTKEVLVMTEKHIDINEENKVNNKQKCKRKCLICRFRIEDPATADEDCQKNNIDEFYNEDLICNDFSHI